MGERTGIEWCDATFNPWIGCEKVSPGCAHCYAETLVTGRMGRAGTWGADGVRQRTSAALWRQPLRWNRLADEGLLPDGTANLDGHRPRIFCASLADVFEPRPELEPWRVELFELIEQTPSLDWLLLTKRPEQARDWLFELDTASAHGGRWVSRDDPEPFGWGCPANVWIGTSIENARFTWRADVLREIPAAVRFISAEPLLGSLFPAAVSENERDLAREAWGDLGNEPAARRLDESKRAPLDLTGIDWVIVGGESGPGARPMHPDWARELRDACLAATMPPGRLPHGEHPYDYGHDRPAFFFKQWGEYVPVVGHLDGLTNLYALTDRGAEPWTGYTHGASTAWDRQAVTARGDVIVRKVGKKRAGSLLDGRTWDEFPARQAVPA